MANPSPARRRRRRQTRSAMKRLLPTSTTTVAVFMGAAACIDASSSSKFGGGRSGFVRKSDLLPDSPEWISLQPDVEFLPGSALDRRNGGGSGDDEPATNSRRLDEARRRLGFGSNKQAYSPYEAQPFVEGESEYDGYQQAWRCLGFMIDCDADNYDDDGGGSYDGGTGEGCERFVLWAAYVDLEYEGGGIGEYQFWDAENQEWDSTSCNYGGGGSGDGGDGSRCAKMDCHEADTHWSLLGLFKHRSYDDWMEQLFKHEGYCVWNEAKYNFMSNAREAWPQGCEESEVTAYDGSTIYYDLKPTEDGGMAIGLYTDTRCVEEYPGNDLTPEDVVGNILLEGGGSGDQEEGENDYDTSEYTLDDSLALWNSIFDTWKICQPCVAYNLNNVGYNVDDDALRGSDYGVYYGYDDDYNNQNYDQDDFDCYDDADYTNVNQCMKFMAKTSMNTATFRDLGLASYQGTLVQSLPVAGEDERNKKPPLRKGVTIFFLCLAVTVLGGGLYMFYVGRAAVKGYKDMPPIFKEPLYGIS